MKKTTKIKTYLLIDYGNSCIKLAIYHNQIKKYITASNTISFNTIIKKYKIGNFDKVILVSSANTSTTNKLLNQIKKYCSDIYLISKKDFIKDIDFSNIKKDVVIGNDILLCAYYLIKKYKSNALLCLGTVYYSIVTKGKKIVTVNLIPNITTGLKIISKITSIPNDLLPTYYDKDIGLNTPDAFASGAKLMVSGYLDLLANTNHLNPKQIIVCGGDANKYLSLDKKYNFNIYASLDALAYFVKDKNL